MNDPHPQTSEAIADQNVERLIRDGYRPESPDAGFVARVQQQMLAASAAQQATASRPRAGSAVESSPLAASPNQLSLLSAGWGVAVLLLIGIIGWSSFHRPEAPSTFRQQDDVVWLNGKAYVSESAIRDPLPGNDLRPLDEMLVGFNPVRRKYDISAGLVARERPLAMSQDPIDVGDAIVTTGNEQRRLTLPDGSVLFVDENTRATLVADRKVEVTAGEIFVEVAPRLADDHSRETFFVTSPERTVTALGTKFGVRVGDAPRVLVTQGKVELSDVDEPLTAGQQFVVHDGIPIMEPAPRADVALGWMRELVAAADGALVPANEKAGGDLIAVDPDGQDVNLSLRKYHIDVHIEDGFARTTIDQTYFNHLWSRLEGTFYFPLPPDASLSRLAMYVGPKLMEGGMAERDYARQVFETIKTRQLDPALLEWVDGSTFKMRVFPLEGRQEKRIILSYTQKLDISYGRTHYRFPAGHNMKVVNDWSVKLRVKDGRGLLWNSPSHTLEAKMEGRDLVLTAEEKLSRLDKDVVLFLNDDSVVESRPAVPDGQTLARLSHTEHENAHYLMLRWRPDLPTEKTRQRRDWVFLFECSADRDPLLARTQIEIIRTVLKHAEYDDTFSIVTAGAYTDVLDKEPLAASHENIANAIAYLEKTHLVGALDVEQAFRSLETFTKDAENPVIVHVGSGTPILGERETGKLASALPQDAQYVGIGVGKRYNRSLMKQAAARSGGYFTQINPDESVNWRGFELVSTLNTPRLLDVRIATDSGACQMLSFADSLAHGEELTAIGRYEKQSDAPSELTITGQLDGQPFKNTVPVKQVENSTGPLPRMWAKQQIELLTSLGAEQHKEQIIKLSKAMYVMSPFTSLLVLENDDMYEQYNIDRGRKDHWALYPAPETIEVVEERDEGRGARGEERTEEGGEKSEEKKGLADDGTSSNEPSKPSVQEVLNTILVYRRGPILYWPNVGYSSPHTTTVWQMMNRSYGWPASMHYHDEFVRFGDGEAGWLGGRVNGRRRVPMLTKLPYVNRLFDTRRSSRDGQSMMMMVTPRILFEEEDESRLGITHFGAGVNSDAGLTGQIVLDGTSLDLWGRSSRVGVGSTTPLVTIVDDSRSMLLEDLDGLIRGTNGIVPGWSQTFAMHDRRVRDTNWDFNSESNRRYDFSVNGTIPYYVQNFSYGNSILRNPMAANDLRPFGLALHSYDSATNRMPLSTSGGLGTGNAAAADFDSLIDLITSTVRPQTWEDVGGPGVIDPFPSNLSLVISQTQTVHDELWHRPLAFSSDGRQLVTGLGDHRGKLWTSDQDSDGYFDYIEESDRSLGLMSHLRPFTNAHRNDELAMLKYELARERAGRAYILASLQDVRMMERDLPAVVDRFNALLDEHRFAEATAIAQAARDFYPDEDVTETMLWKSSFITRLQSGTIRDQTETTWGLMSVDQSAIPFDDESYQLPDVMYWRELSGGTDLTYESGGQTLPSPHYMLDDVQYFDPGPEFKLSREAQALKTAIELPPADSPEWKEILEKARTRRDGVRQALASYVIARTEGRIGQPQVFYESPQFTGNRPVFTQLAAYAPGLNTNSMDVYAVLEAEADVPRAARGSVDAGAQQLIDRARSLGWQKITHSGNGDKPLLILLANGQGDYRYDRRTRFRLNETVLCDGQTLRHLYEEIGLGATRKLSRFHRQQFSALVPWAVLPAEDLSLNADVRLVNNHTIAITPLFADARRAYVETQLVFLTGGRLAERRIVAQPSDEVLLRITYSADGVVRWLSGNGKQLAELNLKVEPTDAPNLTPDESQLVLLPMPARTRDHVFTMAEKEETGDFTQWQKDDALAMIAAEMGDPRRMNRVIGTRFRDRGDRRTGFYTLMLSAGHLWSTTERVNLNPVKDHPDSPLARYIYRQLRLPKDEALEDLPQIDAPEGSFLAYLAELQYHHIRHSKSPSTVNGNELQQRLDFAQRVEAPEFRWAMLKMLENFRGHFSQPQYRQVSAAYEPLTEDPAIGYLARYEYGKSLYYAGQHDQAREVLTKWYEDTLAAGAIPRVDNDFRNAMSAMEIHHYRDLVINACDHFIAQGRRPTAITLAWQTYQLGDSELANELIARILDDVPNADKFAVTLAGVEYFATTSQQRRALALLETLLSDEETGWLSMLWRLGSSIAQGQQMTARSAKMLEEALALEYGALESDDVVNLEQLRNDYGDLLNRYETLANALATLESEPSPALLSRLISVADRWRSMEDDIGLPCNRVASIFSAMGADELAWQYVTTPLAARPNEAAPWLDLAAKMKAEENYAMADRAYREAFQSEGTNAEILWQHATMLKELGRHEDARKLYQQIRNTTWQPRFEYLKSQAEAALRN